MTTGERYRDWLDLQNYRELAGRSKNLDGAGRTFRLCDHTPIQMGLVCDPGTLLRKFCALLWTRL